MDHPKKILILYASAGYGHKKAAKAIEEAYRKKGRHAVRCVDVLTITTSIFGQGYERTYLFLIRHFPWLWGFFYYLTDVRWVYLAVIKPLRRAVNAFVGGRLARLIFEERASVIISTHFLSTEVAGHLKARGQIHSRLVTVVTDFMPHYFWLSPGVDAYEVALPETKQALVKKGVAPEKIYVMGIPVEPKFSRPLSKEAIQSHYSIPKGAFTILLTSGAAAVGPFKKMVESLRNLKRPLQILVVCGNNDRLREDLSRTYASDGSVKIFGFVQNMEELMEVADLVVGKGGGLTLSECLAKDRPMLIFRPVPGQESRNARCMEKHGAGVTVHSIRKVRENVLGFLDHPARLDYLKRNAVRLGKPRAAEAIGEWLDHE
ncbi:MAG: hypothetical protein HYZ52_02455 [Candidatus Omnitrophica bacterium]|nr:hypothetical protein [Candidatus Omnitrophota bacterium]